MEHYHHYVMCLGVGLTEGGVVMINFQYCQLVRSTLACLSMGVFPESMS